MSLVFEKCKPLSLSMASSRTAMANQDKDILVVPDEPDEGEDFSPGPVNT